ncbi:hypothetical protein ACFXPJ_36275, partial [Streptomyces goshikiensis]
MFAAYAARIDRDQPLSGLELGERPAPEARPPGGSAVRKRPRPKHTPPGVGRGGGGGGGLKHPIYGSGE